MCNLKEIQELFDRAGLVLWEQQWRLIEQQLEIDELNSQLARLRSNTEL